MARRQNKPMSAPLKGRYASLARVIRRIDKLADRSCDALEEVVAAFADDPPAQARMREVVTRVATEWGGLITVLSDSCLKPHR